MNMNRNDLLLHPVRSRIVGAIAGRALTTAQLAKVLADVPLPSLYRHVRVLTEAEILTVAEVNAGRGTERTYALAAGGGQIDPDSITTPEGHLGALTNLTNLIVHSYRTYLESGGGEPLRGGMTALNLTDEEHTALIQTIRTALAAYADNSPGEGRSRRLFSVIDLPDFEPTPETQ
jgi:DNA-binding transcriptional ArsR family regulator